MLLLFRYRFVQWLSLARSVTRLISLYQNNHLSTQSAQNSYWLDQRSIHTADCSSYEFRNVNVIQSIDLLYLADQSSDLPRRSRLLEQCSYLNDSSSVKLHICL